MEEKVEAKKNSHLPVIIASISLVILLLVGLYFYKSTKKYQATVTPQHVTTAQIATPTPQQPITQGTMNTNTTDTQLDKDAANLESSMNNLNQETTTTDQNLSNTSQDLIPPTQ